MKQHSPIPSGWPTRLLEAEPQVASVAKTVCNSALARPETLSPENRLTYSAYRVGLAQRKEELDAIFRLRFAVFNLALNEGLESAYLRREDNDAFDDVCQHLFVEHRPHRGLVSREICYWGDMNFAWHLLKLLAKEGIEGRIQFGNALESPSDRKAAANASQQAVVQLSSIAYTQGSTRLGN